MTSTPRRPTDAVLTLLADGEAVAEHCKVNRDTIYTWIRRGGTPAQKATYEGRPINRTPFPEPIATFGKTPVWWLPDIDRWLESTGRNGA